MYRYSLLLAFLFALPLSGAAQQAGEAASAYAPARYGRHSLTIQMGLLNRASFESSATAGSASSDSRTNGFAGALTYAYWFQPDWAATVSAGVLDAEASTSVTFGDVRSESAVVVPLLVGATYAPTRGAQGSSLRPYLSGAVGPYLGSATVSRAGAGVSNETISETAFGVRLLGGADWFLGSHVKVGVGVGYHFVGDFDQPIGSVENASGPEFSMALGFIFGRSR